MEFSVVLVVIAVWPGLHGFMPVVNLKANLKRGLLQTQKLWSGFRRAAGDTGERKRCHEIKRSCEGQLDFSKHRLWKCLHLRQTCLTAQASIRGEQWEYKSLGTFFFCKAKIVELDANEMLHIFMCVDEAGLDLNKVKRPEWMCQTIIMCVANAQHGVIHHAASLGAVPQTGFFSCCT